MPVEVKVCGVTTQDAVDAVNAAGADYVGLMFYAKSPRAVTPAQAGALVQGAARPVGLFVEPSDDEVAAALAAVPLAALQVYAPLARAQAVRARFGLPVWWAVGVAERSDLPDKAPGVDRLLLDRKPEPSDTRPGGNASVFDWRVLRGWAPPLPWILAGGLTPENVAAAIEATGAQAVDASSGMERVRGVKDAALVAAFVSAAKGVTIR